MILIQRAHKLIPDHFDRARRKFKLLLAFDCFPGFPVSFQVFSSWTRWNNRDYQIALSKAQTTHMINKLHINSSGLVCEKEEIRRSERSFLGRKFSLDCAPAALLIASLKIVEKKVIFARKNNRPARDSKCGLFRKKERKNFFLRIRLKKRWCNNLSENRV